MRWRVRAERAEELARETEAKEKVIAARWGLVLYEVERSKEHRRENHIVNLIEAVAKGAAR